MGGGGLVGPAVEVDQRQAFDLRGGQNGPGQHPDAAAEVGPLAGHRRQGSGQQGAARIDAVPAEHAGLGPAVDGVDEARRALGDSRVQARRRVRTAHRADAVMPAGVLVDETTEGFQLLLQPRAALVLGRGDGQPAAGDQGLEAQRHGVATLHRARRGQQGQAGERALRQVLESSRAGDQRRELGGAGRRFGHLARRGAIDAVEFGLFGHGVPIAGDGPLGMPHLFRRVPPSFDTGLRPWYG